MLRGCNVHWLRIVEKQSKVLPKGRERSLFRSIGSGVARVPADEDARFLLDALCSDGELMLVPIKRILPYATEEIASLTDGVETLTL